jgi:hypothetical protein
MVRPSDVYTGVNFSLFSRDELCMENGEGNRKWLAIKDASPWSAIQRRVKKKGIKDKASLTMPAMHCDSSHC